VDFKNSYQMITSVVSVLKLFFVSPLTVKNLLIYPLFNVGTCYLPSSIGLTPNGINGYTVSYNIFGKRKSVSNNYYSYCWLYAIFWADIGGIFVSCLMVLPWLM
jgi:hypothetical protein